MAIIGFLLLLLVALGMLMVNLLLHGGEPKKENICTLCEVYTSEALDYIGANKTQEAIIEMLNKTCSYVPSHKEECITMVNHYDHLFYVELSSVQPEKFCRKVCLCEELEFISSMIWNDNCRFCHRAVSDVIEKLKDPHMQMKIIQMLAKSCNPLEKYANKCKGLVFDYGHLILAIAEKILENVDICTILHACKILATKIGAATAIKDVPGLLDS